MEWCDEVLGLPSRWLEEEGRPTTLGSIDEMVIREFLLYLQERPGTKWATIASSTMYNRVNALKSFSPGYTGSNTPRKTYSAI